MIFFSSSEVYGDYKGVMSESVMDEIEVRQMNDYALSKWVNEQQIHNSNTKHGTETVIVRLFNTYGPGEWFHPYRSVNCKFTYHALHGLPVTVYKGHTRSSTYLSDAVRTVSNITDNFKSGETYNIGNNEEHSIEYLSELIWNYTKASDGLISFEDSEIMTTQKKKVDISNSVRDLDHKNTIALDEGVKKTVDWMRAYYDIT
jgi:dTDP-glucose 4,6-dehydratase